MTKITSTPANPPEEVLVLADAPPAPALEIGQKARLCAVHGYIQNPFTLVAFDTDQNQKVEVDSWTKIQHAAGKLVLVED